MTIENTLDQTKLLDVIRRSARGLSRQELAAKMGLKRDVKTLLEPAIKNLLEQGLLFERRGRLYHPSFAGMIPAKIVKLGGTFGFAKKLEEDQEMFIPGRALMGALPGDYVWIRPKASRGELPEGEVEKVITPVSFRFTGVYDVGEQGPVVTPDHAFPFPVRVEEGQDGGAAQGEKVLAEITYRGSRHMEHRVSVLYRFGDSQVAKNCCEAVLAANSIRRTFSEEEIKQAQQLEADGIHPQEIANRLDLRGERIFTIDGADTKDIDDAISLSRTEKGWKLGVHIADVSHYVTPGTPLDNCAFERGTSVYFADSVIPMLPKALSNGICSLNPDEDRLAFSALMELDEKGNLEKFRFAKTVIRSRVKGVYKEINAILDGSADEAILEKYQDLLETIQEMDSLADLLIEKHHRRGGLELESNEAKFLLDENGLVVDILPRGRGKSECMIEEFMLLANEAAATFAKREKLPFVYRVHDKPASEKLEVLSKVFAALGVDTRGLLPVPDPQALSRILESVRGKDVEMIVNNALLRSMAKAKYSDENLGHYGLVLDNYCHFTSPIRRYPDLSIHRIMSAKLAGMPLERIYERYGDFARYSAEHSTEMEIKAMSAERECEDCYKAEYMASRLGQIFEGVVSGAAAYGIYVELPNTVEGLVRIEALPEGNYVYDGLMQLMDPVSGRRYRIGDAVRIFVSSVDVASGMVDFGMVDENGNQIPVKDRGSVQVTVEGREERGGREERTRSGQPRRSRGGRSSGDGARRGKSSPKASSPRRKSSSGPRGKSGGRKGSRGRGRGGHGATAQ